jgi:hypothetical protein
MLGVVASAVALAALLAVDPQACRDFTGVPPGEIAHVTAVLRVIAFLLVCLALLTFTAGWQGLLVLRARRHPLRGRGPFTVAVDLLNVLVGPPALVLSGLYAQPLLAVFGALCFLSGASHLWKWSRPSPDPRNWLYEHLSGMIGSGIAAHTAFVTLGVARLFPALYYGTPALYMALWIAPTVIGFAAIAWLQRH